MRFDVVRQPLMAAFITLLVFAIAAMASVGSTHADAVTASASLLGGYITQFQTAWPLTAKIGCALLIFLAGSSLGRMTVRYSLYPVHTYLAIPFYGFFACGLFIDSEYTVQYLASALLVSATGNLCACFRNGSYGFGEIFRASLCLGLIPLIYTPGILLAAVMPLAVAVFKRSGREFLVGAAGYVLPFLTLCYLNWVAGGPFTAPAAALGEALGSSGGFSVPVLSLPALVLTGVLLVLFSGSAICYFLDIYAAGSKPRSILLFMLLLFPLTAASFFLPCATPGAAALAAVPAATILPLLFVRLDRRIARILYLGLIFLCGMRFFY